MPPDESEFFGSDRGHYEYLRRQREAGEDAAAQERSRRAGCGLLWLLPALLAVASIVALHDVVASHPWWSEGIADRLPGDWAQAARAHAWASALLGVAVLAPFWLLSWGLAVVRQRTAVRMARGWLVGPVRWLWLLALTAVRAFLTLGGLVTAWQVVRLVRGLPLQDVGEVDGAAILALALVLSASAVRAFALHRQLPHHPRGGR